MQLPTNLFLDGIQEKKVYYFSNNDLNTAIPHSYICLKRTPDDLLVLSCCTSKFETIRKFVETRNLPYETLVWLEADDIIFTKDTYINCNQYFEKTVEEFKDLYENGRIEFRGEISDSHFEQIIYGLIASPLIDEEIKDILPKL